MWPRSRLRKYTETHKTALKLIRKEFSHCRHSVSYLVCVCLCFIEKQRLQCEYFLGYLRISDTWYLMKTRHEEANCVLTTSWPELGFLSCHSNWVLQPCRCFVLFWTLVLFGPTAGQWKQDPPISVFLFRPKTFCCTDLGSDSVQWTLRPPLHNEFMWPECNNPYIQKHCVFVMICMASRVQNNLFDTYLPAIKSIIIIKLTQI